MRPVLIGITGPSCSGKSSLARGLQRALNGTAGILPLDAYYRDLTHLHRADRDRFNFDAPDALDHELLHLHLRSLAAGRAIDRPIYRFEDHRRTAKTAHLEPVEWLIVEGLFALYWESLSRLMSRRVFLKVDDEVCLARRVRRDSQERGRTVSSVEVQYEEFVRPMFERFVRPTLVRAELILDGTQPVQDLVRICQRYATGGS